MSDKEPTTTSLGDVARERAREAGKRCDSASERIRENLALLLELRDRRIRKLEEKLAKAAPERARHRVLVVDDAESMTELMNRYLEGQPVEVVCVLGNDLLHRLRSRPDDYDAIMIEPTACIQPNVDGMALCRQLCERGKGDRVIVMSSRPGDKIKNSVEEEGATFLRKPFGREQLLRLMRDVLPRAGHEQEEGEIRSPT